MFIQVTNFNDDELRINTGALAYYSKTPDGETMLRWIDGSTLFVRQPVEALDQALKVWKTVKEEK